MAWPFEAGNAPPSLSAHRTPAGELTRRSPAASVEAPTSGKSVPFAPAAQAKQSRDV